MSHHEEWEEIEVQRQLQRMERKIDALLKGQNILIVEEGEEEAQQVRDFTISQIQGDFSAMPITGTVVGTTSTFNIGFLPATNFIPLSAGPTVAVDDTTVTLTAVDASNNFTASVPAGSTAASYNLTISGANGAGTALIHTFNIPIQPVPPPPPVQVTDFSLSQVS
jgi:hypothetical protein